MMGNDDSTSTELLETATSTPVKKKGRPGRKKKDGKEGDVEQKLEKGETPKDRRKKKKAVKEGEDGDVEQKLEEGVMVVVGRGRPKKIRGPKKSKKVVKIQPASPSPDATDEMQPSSPSDVPPTQTDQVETPNDMPQKTTSITSDPAAPVVKRRRGGGKGMKKTNLTEATRAVVTVSYKNLVDINDIVPDELILPEELAGFEHVQVFHANTMLGGSYKLQNNTQEERADVYPATTTLFGPSSMQFNAGISFGVKNSVTLQMYPKIENQDHFQ